MSVNLAVEQYKTNKMSVNRAAELAGYSPEEFKAVLRKRNVGRDVGVLDGEERATRLKAIQ